MKEKITKRGLYAVSAKTLDENRAGAVALMNKYGVKVKPTDDQRKIDAAFMALLPRSKGFRKEFALLAVPHAAKMHKKHAEHSNYIGMSGDWSNAAANLPPSKGLDTIPVSTGGTKTLTLDTTTLKKGQPKAKTKKSFGDTAFGSWLGSVFTPEQTQGIINTGLNIYAFKQTGGNVGTNPLDQGRQDYKTFDENAGDTSKKSTGIGTTGIMLVSIASISLIGYGIYKMVKK